MIVISHRLSTLGHVDEIAVLEGGRIIERGTYSELKNLGGSFARLLAEQNRYAAEPVLLPLQPDGNGHVHDGAGALNGDRGDGAGVHLDGAPAKRRQPSRTEAPR